MPMICVMPLSSVACYAAQLTNPTPLAVQQHGDQDGLGVDDDRAAYDWLLREQLTVGEGQALGVDQAPGVHAPVQRRLAGAVVDLEATVLEIGRASCRERG